MMEEIFFAGGDALVYLAKQMHKNCSITFVWGHPFSTYLSHDLIFNPIPLYAPIHILDDSPPFPHLCKYLMHGQFLNQKQIRIFECRIH